MRVSVNRVFNNVSRNLGLSEYNKHTSSWIEWAFEAEQYIGSRDTFERAEMTFSTESAKATAEIVIDNGSTSLTRLNNEFISIDGTKFRFRTTSTTDNIDGNSYVNEVNIVPLTATTINYSATLNQLVAKINASHFSNVKNITVAKNDANTKITLTYDVVGGNGNLVKLDCSDELEITKHFEGGKGRIQNKQITIPNNIVKLLNVRVGDTIIEPTSSQFRSKVSDVQDRYYVEGNRINFSKDYTEDVTISYLRVHTDSDGYPTIRQGHEEAVAFYIMWKQKSIGYYSGKVPQYIVKDLERRWYQLCGKARGDDNMPSSIELLKIGKIWNSKVPVTSHNPPLYDGLNSY